MSVLFKLRQAIEQAIARYENNRKRVLRNLAGVKLSDFEAYLVWPRVLDHKWFLSEQLGRDVGLRVAAVDYFENIQPLRPRVSIWADQDALPPRLPMMLRLGERP